MSLPGGKINGRAQIYAQVTQRRREIGFGGTCTKKKCYQVDIFQIKRNEKVQIEICEARLVAKRFSKFEE